MVDSVSTVVMPVRKTENPAISAVTLGQLRDEYYQLTQYRQFVSSECNSVVKLTVNLFRPKSRFPVPVVARSRRGAAAVHLLRLWVRIPPGAWMFVC